ncbi:MAG: DctP family TRAP transporter solute-binding subunit [Actinomycetota bacterium]|jgi:C4-dicarboxylate-binding protein DctP|nr:DctP family TRAP transporter solute-binding subunit [Actinomycetota bacterium]
MGRTGLLLGAFLLIVVAAGCGARGGGVAEGGAEYTIRFSHVQTEDTPKGLAAARFKEEVEEGSGGRIEVEIFPNSQLYGDEDELQAQQSGSVEMLAPAPAKLTTIAPQLQVLDLPFIFESYEEIPEVVTPESSVGRAIYENENLEERNIRVLGLWDLGLKQFASNQEIQSLEDLEDLEGQTLRIQSGSDVLRTQMETWGAEPTPMSFSEVYNALQQGVIDGLENTYSSFYSQNMHTVQDYITVSNHGYIGYVLTVNEEFHEGLPGDLQQAVQEAADEASAYNREIAEQENREARRAIEEAGTTEFIEMSEEDRQALKEEVVPRVYEEHVDVIGREIVDELLAREEQAAR